MTRKTTKGDPESRLTAWDWIVLSNDLDAEWWWYGTYWSGYEGAEIKRHPHPSVGVPLRDMGDFLSRKSVDYIRSHRISRERILEGLEATKHDRVNITII